MDRSRSVSPLLDGKQTEFPAGFSRVKPEFVAIDCDQASNFAEYTILQLQQDQDSDSWSASPVDDLAIGLNGRLRSQDCSGSSIVTKLEVPFCGR